MDKLKWIESDGGPLILISEISYKLWSGVLNRASYLENRFETADDFMDADQADYGKACLVDDYLGTVDVGEDKALVLGDEPLSTTAFLSKENKVVIARCYYGETIEFVDKYLHAVDLTSINNWEFSLALNLSSDKQFLFDSAYDAGMLNKENENYLQLNIKQGLYKIWTSLYEPDETTQLLLHKFEMSD